MTCCPICRTEISESEDDNDKEHLHDHLETQHGFKKCDKCPLTLFISPGSLESHSKRYHNNEESSHRKRQHDGNSEGESPTKKEKGSNIEVVIKKELKYVNDSFLVDVGGQPIMSIKRIKPKLVEKDSQTENEAKDADYIPEDDDLPEQSQPNKFNKDPLSGFFLQTVMECKECPERPTRKFAFFNSWQVHIKGHHKDLSTIALYKEKHGDPDLVKFKHRCRLCNLTMRLNLTVIKRHLNIKHGYSVDQYKEEFREELIEERKTLPIVGPKSTLDGWWEGCLYSCKLCSNTTTSSQLMFENHLSNAHGISSQSEIETEYVQKFGSLCTINRKHECFICQKLIRHEYKCIFHHLSKHQIDMETYTKTYKSELICELKEKGMEYVINREKEVFSKVSLEEYNKSNEETDDGKLMESWYDCSQHSCAICGETFWSNLKFHWHVKRDHGLLGTREYRRDHGDPEVTLRQHKCLICGSLVKWEACRIRDHLKAHKNKADKLSLREYGKKFIDYILPEVKRIKEGNSRNEEKPMLNQDTVSVRSDGFSSKEWKQLFVKKLYPNDKVVCVICKKVMNRHSYTKHQRRAHNGILDTRDLNRLKMKQLQLAKSGMVQTLGELMKDAGGVAVVKGKGEVVDIDKEDQESRVHLFQAGLTLDHIEQKVSLISSGLKISRTDQNEIVEDEIIKPVNYIEEIIPEPVEETVDIVDDTDQNVFDEQAVSTYVVDQHTGEILLINNKANDLNNDNIEEYEDTDYESETEVGPLDGRIMEIDLNTQIQNMKNISNTAPEEEVRIIVLNEVFQDSVEKTEKPQEVNEERDISNTVILSNQDQEVQFVVEDKFEEKVTNPSDIVNYQSKNPDESVVNSFLYVSDEGNDPLELTKSYKPSPWIQLGSEQDYEPRLVSKPQVETDGRVSEGTMMSQWTKLAGDRVRVSTSKLITPSSQSSILSTGVVEDVSGTLMYSSYDRLFRDVGCQVTPHRVNGVPTNKYEEQRQADTIRKFLECGGVFDRTCPGCGKTMSRTRNLISHIQVIHGVEVDGVEKEEHILRHTRENIKVSCDFCSKIVSRKSIKRHINLCHSKDVT